MKKVNVLEVTGEPIGSGGQESFIANVFRYINLSGLHLDLLTLYFCENELYRSLVEKRGGSVICFNLHYAPNALRYDIFLPMLHFLRLNKYDVVHIHSGSTTVLSLISLAAYLSGVKKIIVHSHTTGLKKNFKYYLLKTFTYPLLNWIPDVYCACSELAGIWKYPQHVINNKLLIVKNGIDLDLFSPNTKLRNEIRSKLKISDSTILIGHVGRFSFVKNHSFLIKIMEHMRSRNFDCKMILIGNGELYADVIKMVNQKQLDDFIVFVGNTPNVNEYMQAMDVFVLPSRWEGLPLVGVEAQGAGLPVLVSDKVSMELKLVDDVKFLPIDDVELWVDELTNIGINRVKSDNREVLKRAGYDIVDTTTMLRKLYLGQK